MGVGRGLIRLAVPEDAEGIARVRVETWRSAYQGIVPQKFLDELDAAKDAARWNQAMKEAPANRFALVADDPQAGIIGFAAGGPSRDQDPGSGELYALYVLDEHQRRGVGQALWAAFREEAAERGFPRLWIWVLEANPNEAFYRRMGGALLGRKEKEIGGARLPELGFLWHLVH